MLPARNVRILGSTELWWDGVCVPLVGRRSRALVATLALAPGSVVSRTRLAESVWGEQASSDRLDVQVSRLRRALRDAGADSAIIQTAPGGYRLMLGRDAVDAFVAESALAQTRESLASGDARAALDVAQAARALWRGAPLVDLPDDVEAFRLEELLREVDEEIVEARLALGEGPALVARLEAATARDPLRARLHEQLMRALHSAGRDAEALAVYERLRVRLATELGIDPPATLRDLHERILRQEPALDPLPARGSRGRPAPPAWRPWVLSAFVALAAAVGVVAVVAVTGGAGGRPPALASVLRPDGIAVLDARDGHLVAQAPAGGRTGNESTGNTLFAYGSVWALAENGTITQVDPNTGEVEHRYPLAKAPTGMAAGRADVWVAFYDAAVLVRIQPLTHTTVEVPLPARHRRGPGVGAGGIAIGAGAVWVTRPDGVERLDPVTGRVVARVALPGALSIVVAAGGVWAASRDAGILSRIDPRTNRITARVTLPANVCCLASAPDGLFASSEAPGLVSRISRDGHVEGSFHLPGTAADLAYAAGHLWVSGLGSGHLTSIDVASGAQRTYDAGTTVAGVAAFRNRVAFGFNTDARSMLAHVRGRVARVLLPTDLIADIDPATPGVNGSAPFARFVARATCAGLFTWPDRPAPDGATLVPELSRDGGSVSADGLTWIFHVRTGYRFSPPARTAVTATTVADTIDRALSPELKAAPAARLLSDVAGLPAYRARRASHLAGVRALGDVVEIHLRRPVPDLPARLASSVFCVVPDGTPAVSGGVLDPLPGAGPYYVAARAGGVFEVLLRNPSYHGPRPKRFAGLGFDLASDPVAAIARVRNGSADLAVSDKPGAGLASTPLLVTDVLRVSGALRRNFLLRHAVADAVDRRALADMLGGVPADRLLPPALARPASRPPAAPPPRSDRAAGTVTVGTCNGACTTLADEIVRELSRAGLRAHTAARRPELTLERIEALDPDPADFLALGLGSALPRALAKALALSRSARATAARAVDLRLTRAGVIIPLANPVTAEAWSRKLGCVHVDPFEPGTDLAALCPNRNSS